MKCEHTEEDEKESQTEDLEVDNEIQSETDFEVFRRQQAGYVQLPVGVRALESPLPKRK